MSLLLMFFCFAAEPDQIIVDLLQRVFPVNVDFRGFYLNIF